MNDAWPWLALAGLGAIHGLNPAMGWLFAVALGLHRRDRRVVWLSLLPIALGHALSVALVAGVFVWAGVMVQPHALRLVAGLVLIAWALWHWRYRSRHRVRIGMQTGMAGLCLWSFLMATAHGAGLMVVPVFIGMSIADEGGHTHHMAATGAGAGTALLATGLHAVGYLAVTAFVAVLVFEKLGVGILRRAWINLDLIWAAALMATGTLTLLL
ncbi:MAG: hypothetical protein ACREVB_12440 [Burkholderiales bacterium]